MVYVLNVNKKPLMPCTEAKARKLLKKNKAKIVNGSISCKELEFVEPRKTLIKKKERQSLA